MINFDKNDGSGRTYWASCITRLACKAEVFESFPTEEEAIAHWNTLNSEETE